MKISIKKHIIEFLTQKNDWVFGGQIEDYIRRYYGNKASNASRRCRELYNCGLIEKRLVKAPNSKTKVVQYRISRGVGLSQSERQGVSFSQSNDGDFSKSLETQRLI